MIKKSMHPALALVKNAVKLALAGSTIALTAFLFLAVNPSGQVQDTQADIAFLGFSPTSNDQRFQAALNKLDHPTPRVYDYNGNTVFFSVVESKKTPVELLLEYQHEFVRQGVNEEVWGVEDTLTRVSEPSPDDAPEQIDKALRSIAIREAMLTGQIVPIHTSPESVVMTGALLKDIDDDRETFQKHMEERKIMSAKDPFNKLFNAYRTVQIDWDNDTHTSTVTASWSHKGFDIRKTHPPEIGGTDEGRGVNTDVPACPGCSMEVRIDGTGVEAPLKKVTYVTKQSPVYIQSFYTNALAKRGWQQTNASKMTEKMGDRVPHNTSPTMLFARGPEFLSLSINYDTESELTYINAQTSN
jgi:hypothetical protein